jgi:hypothetical protein
MYMVIGLAAATLIGAPDPAPPPSPPPSPPSRTSAATPAPAPARPGEANISYKVTFLDMKGPGWRGAVYSRLQQVARRGDATVWTTTPEVASTLAENAASVLAAPRVAAYPLALATVVRNTTRKITTELKREADGPVNHASFVGYVPRIEDAAEGYAAQLTGRKIDQGVLVRLHLRNQQVIAVHPVGLSEVVQARNAADEPAKVQATLQVPEVARSEVSGEWLIPNDGVLLVSFGVHTVADDQGKAKARERLAVIEANEVGDDAPGRATLTTTTDAPGQPFCKVAGVVAGTVLAASPAVPSRTLPQAVDPSGAPVALPPLPHDHTPPTSLPGTSEPCATPQSACKTVLGRGDHATPCPASSLDPDSTRVNFEATPDGSDDKEHTKGNGKGKDKETSAKPDGPAGDAGTCAAETCAREGKPVVLRLPPGRFFQIEVSFPAVPANPAD